MCTWSTPYTRHSFIIFAVRTDKTLKTDYQADIVLLTQYDMHKKFQFSGEDICMNNMQDNWRPNLNFQSRFLPDTIKSKTISTNYCNLWVLCTRNAAVRASSEMRLHAVTVLPSDYMYGQIIQIILYFYRA